MCARCGKATAALQERKAHSSTWSTNYSHLPNRTAHNGALRCVATRCTLAPVCPTELRNNGLLVETGIRLARVLERTSRPLRTMRDVMDRAAVRASHYLTAARLSECSFEQARLSSVAGPHLRRN
jgi:hypothetical protein